MSSTSLSSGACEKSGPVGVIGTNAMPNAIMIPPQAMKGMAYETPVSRCWRSFWSAPNMRVSGGRGSRKGPLIGPRAGTRR